jgi:arabinogalactan oligomer/maltooligosaccharide transport system substrate-binding protein
MPPRPGPQLSRRTLIRQTAALGIATMLGACSGMAPAAEPTPAAADTPATLILWHGWAGLPHQALGQLVERFNRTGAGGRIVLQSVALASFAAELRSAAQAGSGPHLALIPSTWAGALAADGLLLALDEQLAEDDRRALIPSVLGGAEAAGQNGGRQLFGLPLSFDTSLLFYNNANLLAPPEDTTALLASARGLSAPDADPPIWGLALSLSLDLTIGYLYAFEGRVFDNSGALVLGTAGRDGAERWLAWVRELSEDRRIFAHPDSSIAVDHELRGGRVLATFDWAHRLGVYRGLWGEKLGLTPLPRLAETGQPPQPYIRSDMLVVNARAAGRERDAALAFLRFMIAEETQLALFHADLQPARAIALPSDDPRAATAQAFRAQAAQAQPMPNGLERAAVDQELRFMLQQVLNGFTSPTDAVSEADRRLRARLGI